MSTRPSRQAETSSSGGGSQPSTPIVEAFEEEHPNVNVTLANVGTGNDHYVALQNAILAGSGVPDVAQIEFYALPQFTASDSLADLTPFGAAELESEFAPGPWGAVTNGEAVVGLPGGGGPMALFYNVAVFERLGVEVPTTWDEYLEAGRQLHAADPTVYVATDGADPGYTTSMIWQAGGQPFRVDGTTVGVDLADEGTLKYAGLWQQLLDEELLSSIPAWSDEWFSSLGDGSIATMVTGAWMALNLQSSSPTGAGDWRVAPMPVWEEGDTANSRERWRPRFRDWARRTSPLSGVCVHGVRKPRWARADSRSTQARSRPPRPIWNRPDFLVPSPPTSAVRRSTRCCHSRRRR